MKKLLLPVLGTAAVVTLGAGTANASPSLHEDCQCQGYGAKNDVVIKHNRTGGNVVVPTVHTRNVVTNASHKVTGHSGLLGSRPGIVTTAQQRRERQNAIARSRGYSKTSHRTTIKTQTVRVITAYTLPASLHSNRVVAKRTVHKNNNHVIVHNVHNAHGVHVVPQNDCEPTKNNFSKKVRRG
jgi:hypothetical protein